MLYGLHLGTPSCVLHLTGDLTLQLIAVITQRLSSGKDPEVLCVGCMQLGMGCFVGAL